MDMLSIASHGRERPALRHRGLPPSLNPRPGFLWLEYLRLSSTATVQTRMRPATCRRGPDRRRRRRRRCHQPAAPHRPSLAALGRRASAGWRQWRRPG
jgi:hypothetical protein